MALVSGGLAAYSSYSQGKAQQANAKYNAKVAQNQALQTNMEARENVRRQSRNNESQLSAARARLANQGSVATAGAPLALMGDVAGELELGILDAYRSADAQRSNFLAESAIEKNRGKQASGAGKLMAVSSILGAGATAYGNYQTGKRTGLF